MLHTESPFGRLTFKLKVCPKALACRVLSHHLSMTTGTVAFLLVFLAQHQDIALGVHTWAVT